MVAAASLGAGAAAGDDVYARPGVGYSSGSGSLNFYCFGSGAPAVVFDQGWGDWSPAWAVVQPKVAAFTRACSYDRAGYGFSDPGPMPRTSVRNAEELHAALHNAGIAPPYILVAAHFGSYNMRVFADRYMPEVAGIVLSDADDGDVEPAKWRARELTGFRKTISGMRVCRDAVGRKSPLPASCPKSFFRGLPEQTFSNELNAALLHEVQTQTALYDAAISEMEQMPNDETYLQQHVTSFGSRPIRVLTTWHFGRPPDKPADVHRWHLAFEHDSALAQGSWLHLSTNARQSFDYEESRQYLQLDHPQIVLNAIRDVFRTVASRQP
jgi:pimeloyl-ACP methyl ester carboxylesterase